ncbi:MAG: hypothetical protein AAFX85_02345 [Pseudomonadota bacterium]
MSDPTDRLRAVAPQEDDGTIDLSGTWVRDQRSRPPRSREARRPAGARAASRSGAVHVSPAMHHSLLTGGMPSAALLSALAHPRAAVQASLLTESLPITPIRQALWEAYTRAREDGDAEATSLALEAAATVDGRRSALIERLLGDFFTNYPQHEERIVAVVEGGATRGDPEYRGVFGDIDITVFIDSAEQDHLAQVSEALATSFAWTGYPLTQGGCSPTLDLHVFVDAAHQPIDETHLALASAGHMRAPIGVHNPGRFVSDAGLRWVINQMYFSGRPLRGLVERACQPRSIARTEAAALASDVTSHMGAALARVCRLEETADHAHERRLLTAALDEAKHVLRLVDAWLLSDPLGNALYHDRFAGLRHTTRGTSYHERVVEDALAVLGAGRGGAALVVEDRPLLRHLAQLKLRSQHLTPWDYLGYDADALRRAYDLARQMFDLTQRVGSALDLGPRS